ncbi:hypothetical protein OH76DRAFT_235363 [Lentinus brumalis]|uniref:Uncharacterized protein n=1 Tax=Lentinus brumalis TaxID=2498619 RepID=A0A371DHH6_9APHY|nr:hypothetical protein OH76DRAFT_235363 [Polyporus brumalis]
MSAGPRLTMSSSPGKARPCASASAVAAALRRWRACATNLNRSSWAVGSQGVGGMGRRERKREAHPYGGDQAPRGALERNWEGSIRHNWAKPGESEVYELGRTEPSGGDVEKETNIQDAGVSARTYATARHVTTIKWSSPSAAACARRDWESEREGWTKQTTSLRTPTPLATPVVLCRVVSGTSGYKPFRRCHVEGGFVCCSPEHTVAMAMACPRSAAARRFGKLGGTSLCPGTWDRRRRGREAERRMGSVVWGCGGKLSTENMNAG